ncbi:PQQ-dependent catabolism-associated CXXCW motif protein [Mesorhizobium sp. SP-1A]|uniref:PQQ-dependent catabolism-associated CXXCW motif protein n=1 Tax=Mesorhizobium sp. SP-1A TaxID=3077840 RepID=UPI0028F707EE|nr:PQQ-dependent catabolism-associated CXXCW motif protein [Mesorhizobium sp. SP-1A]
MKEKVTALLLAASLPGHFAPAWAETVEEPAGYRMEGYHAPVPATLRGAKVVTTGQAEALWRGGEVVFLDTMAHTPKPADLPAGTIWREPGRKDIPGSLWLANVGYGALPPETEAYYRKALEKASRGAKDKALLFYCMTDCWMSWNAARRAIEWGYSAVLWYPPGADGWEKAKLPLNENRPYILEN